MRRWKQIIAPWLVFFLGVLCGVGGTAIVAVKKIRGWIDAPPAEMVQRGAGLLARRLDLDADQRESLQPVIDELQRELAEVRIESIPRIRELIDHAERQARPHLRPEQRRKLDALLAAPRARWEQLAPAAPPSDR